MIKLADRYHCTGCTTCANVCSHHAIMMQPDDEGFLQPVIDSNKCIKCELCMKCCPVLNPLFLNKNTILRFDKECLKKGPLSYLKEIF